MNRKIRSGILALFAAIFALAVVIAPTRAWADELWNYTDSATGAAASIESEGLVGKNHSLTVKVLVDGVLLESDTVEGLPWGQNYLNTTTPEGYDVVVRADGMAASPLAGGRYSLTWMGSEDPTLVVSFAKEGQTSGSTQIVGNDTVYGTFSWQKNEATTAAYPRLVTVNVNGQFAYSQYISTPETLSNALGSNAQYWFTPNQEPYSIESVELNPDSTLSATERDLTINLKTRCMCGNDLCQCEGGCTCEEGCPCNACNPTITENMIDTGYGIVEFKDPVDLPGSGGYNLTVRVFVNGQQSFESKQLRVRSGELGCLNFTPKAGYFYHEPNGYDIISDRASTWRINDGYLFINGDRDDTNILQIYLWTFNNHTNLDVERGVGDADYMRGYNVSYVLTDPLTGEQTTVSYDANSFAAGQTTIIPIGVPVTVTAQCTPGWEIDEWSTGEVYGGDVVLTSEGDTDTTDSVAPGNSCVLTVNGTAHTRVIINARNVNPAEVPTSEEVIDLVGENGVLVDCVNQNVDHEDKEFPLSAESLKIERTDNATVKVTVAPGSYISAYETAMGDEDHWADPETQNLTFTLEHDGTDWKVAAGQTPVKLKVDCDAEPAPEPPTTDDIEGLLANNAVSVTDKNDEVDHGDYETAIFGPIDYSYRIGDVAPTTDGGYTCDVTFESIYYVNAYEERVGSDHKLAEGEQSEKAIRFVWDAENIKWAVDENASPVNFDVVCQTPAPDQPDLPGIDDLPIIFGTDGAVLIDCVNTKIDPDHADVTYDIKAATYGWENFGADDNGQYTVDLRVSPYAYVNAYSADNGAHSLTTGSDDIKVITLAYDSVAQAWEIAAGQPQQFFFQVVCETPQPGEPAVPEPPTDDELQKIFADSLVSVDCITSGVKHDHQTFMPIAEGGYAFGEVYGNVEEGATVVMTVFPQAYVGAYEIAYGNIPHALTDGQKAATVTLTYANGSWNAAENFAPIAYTVFCTTCPSVPGGDTTPDAPSIDEVNDRFADGAVKVTCVNEDVDHGSETYELKNGAATVGAPTKDGGSWKVVVTVTPGQYVLDFQTSKGVHHTLQPSDQGEKTFTLVYTSGKWVLEDSDALIEYTVICADDVTGPDDPGTDPGTDPDDPGTDPDDPGTNPDDPGTNPDDPGTDPDDPGTDPDKPGTDPDKPGTDPGTNPDDPGNDQGNGGNNIGGKRPSGSKIPNAGDATNVGLVTTVALAGVTASGAAFVAYKRQR